MPGAKNLEHAVNVGSLRLRQAGGQQRKGTLFVLIEYVHDDVYGGNPSFAHMTSNLGNQATKFLGSKLLFGKLGDLSRVADPQDKAADRATALKILGKSFLLAFIVTLVVLVLPF